MFLNVIMLAGIGGAAVPLILHLLNRARYRSVDWGAMMFLYGDDARQRQSSRLRQLLLLLIRMALVALLAVALARPLVSPKWSPAGQDTPLKAVILLDRSGSMGYGENGHTRMDEAREAVRQILAGMRRGDEAALIALGDNTRGPTPRPTADLQSINDALAGGNYLKSGYGTANLSDGLKLAADMFDRVGGGNRAVFIVCDRQALNWEQVDAKYAAAWRSRTSMPGPAPRCFVVPIGGEESDSIAIESVNVLAPQVVVGQPVDVEVSVHNYGPSARAAVPVSLSANRDGGHVIKTTVNIGARASTTIRQTMTLFSAGSQVINARIAGGGMAGDDSMGCSVDVVNPINVLIVSGETHHGRQLNQGDYLKFALMPFAAAGRGAGDVASVQIVTPSSSDDWANFDGKKYRVVILADVGEITPSQARALEQHVYAGGGLLVSPGGLTQVDNINAMLYRDGAGILPAQLKAPTPADGSLATTILGIEMSHPLFRFLKGKPDPIPSAIVGRYFPALARQPDGHVLASFGSGQPFVVEGRFGRGKVILFTSPLDGDWGTLPMTNFYLPMVQSAVRYLAAKPNRNLKLGDPIIADFDEAGNARVATITTPESKDVVVPLQEAGDQFEARFTDTRVPGIYTVAVGDRQRVFFAVTASSEESDITPLTAGQWTELSGDLGFRLIEPGAQSVAGVLAEERAKRELWPILLAAVLALAVMEVALGRAWTHA